MRISDWSSDVCSSDLYAPCFAALGGPSALVGHEGEPPAGMNIRYADSTFGTAAAYAATVALLHRRRTGQGQFFDVSAVESMTSMNGDAENRRGAGWERVGEAL